MENSRTNSAELNETSDISEEQSHKVFDLFNSLLNKNIELSHKYQDTYFAQIENEDLRDSFFEQHGINLVTFGYWTHYKLPIGIEKPCLKIMIHEVKCAKNDGYETNYNATKDIITSLFIINNEPKPTKKSPSIGQRKFYPFYDQEIFDFEQEPVEHEKWHLSSNPFSIEETEKIVELLDVLKKK
ncbi:MAG: hypothetical protein WCP03_01800 [Candidatus Saccharibacteria bacterium]